ncbi:MAG: hypothetical protein M0C28_01635 [Candidatus Moduliflexus flocculans]|nr:hypothetical protein [Candidatus Moduliflexus flocculans]
MTTPEPTAIENTYLFLKSCIMRVLKLYMDHYKIQDLHQQMLDQIEKNSQSLYGFFKSLMETDRAYGTILYRALRGFRPCLVMNKTRDEHDVLLGRSVADVVRKYLLVDMKYLGAVPYDEDVHHVAPRPPPLLHRPPRLGRGQSHPADVRGAGLFDRIHPADPAGDPSPGHLMLKKIEDWNYYELLSVERTASQDEVWEAYQAALGHLPGRLARPLRPRRRGRAGPGPRARPGSLPDAPRSRAAPGVRPGPPPPRPLLPAQGALPQVDRPPRDRGGPPEDDLSGRGSRPSSSGAGRLSPIILGRCRRRCRTRRPARPKSDGSESSDSFS